MATWVKISESNNASYPGGWLNLDGTAKLYTATSDGTNWQVYAISGAAQSGPIMLDGNFTNRTDAETALRRMVKTVGASGNPAEA